MKIKLLFFLCFIYSLNHAQVNNINWSEKIDYSGYNYIGQKNEKLYFEKYQSNLAQGDRVTYKVFDGNLKEISQKYFSFKSDTINYTFFKTLFFDDAIGQVIRFKDKKNKSEVLRIALNDDDLNTKGEFKKVHEMSNKINPILLGLHQCFSPDKSKLLVYCSSFEERGLKQDLHYKVFSTATMSLLFEGKFETPVASTLVTRKSTIVDNDGNVILLNKINRTIKEQKEGLKAFHVVNVISRDNKLSELKVDEGIASYNLDLQSISRSKIILTGFTITSAGTIYIINEINGNTAKMEAKTTIVANDLFLKYNDDKKEEILPYETIAVFQKSDGGYSAVLRQIKRTLVHSQYGYRENAILGDIANIQTDDKSNLLKCNVFPYKGSSLATTFKADTTFITHLDNEDNALLLYRIASNGDFKNEVVCQYSDKEKVPSQGIEVVSPGVFVLLAKNHIGILKL